MSLQGPHNRRKPVRRIPNFANLSAGVRFPGEPYWYIVAVVQGRRFIDGAYNSKEEAKQAASRHPSLLNVRYEIIPHKSKNRDYVQHHLMHEIWEQTDDLNEAFMRMRHK